MKKQIKKIVFMTLIMIILSCGVGALLHVLTFIGIKKTLILIGSIMFLYIGYNLTYYINIKF